MRLVKIYGLFLLFGLIVSCNTPSDIMNEPEAELLNVETKSHNVIPFSNRATGELWAKWQGCEDEHESGDIQDDSCEGGDDGNDSGDCEDEHGDEGHEGGQGCQGARPAREFYLQFDAQLKHNKTKGNVTLKGIKEYEGIDFDGTVTWVKSGRESNEIFFGGVVTGSTVNVDRDCFLFYMRDNGEGVNVEADRMQYRLFRSSTAPCNEPDHLPKGYPIAVYEGNLQVY